MRVELTMADLQSAALATWLRRHKQKLTAKTLSTLNNTLGEFEPFGQALNNSQTPRLATVCAFADALAVNRLKAACFFSSREYRFFRAAWPIASTPYIVSVAHPSSF